MSDYKCNTFCSFIDKFKECIFNEDISYLYPSNWNFPCCHISSNKITELEEIKKEIEAIKKFNGFNINPLCKTRPDDTGTDDIIENTGEDNVIDDNIRNSIINLKTDLQRFNVKLNEIELNIVGGRGTDAFCIVEIE